MNINQRKTQRRTSAVFSSSSSSKDKDLESVGAEWLVFIGYFLQHAVW